MTNTPEPQYPGATIKHEELSDGSTVWNIVVPQVELYATSNQNAERHCRRINSAINDAILGLHPLDDDSDDLFSPRERDLLNHEKQTHAELGAILGTDDNLKECATRMRDALAQLLKWIDCGCDPSTKSLEAARAVLDKAKAETKIINGPGELRCTTVARWQYDDVLNNATRLDATLNRIRAILWPDGNKEYQWSADTLEGIAAVLEAQAADHDADFGMKGGVS